MSDATVGDPLFDPAVRRQVLELLRERLETRRHALVASDGDIDQFLRQADSVLDEVETAMPGREDGTATRRQSATGSLAAETGVGQADRWMYPAESLRSFHIAFETLLCVVQSAQSARQSDDHAVLRGIESLHASVLRKLEAGVTSHARTLLAAADASHRDELSRITRELHDLAAHSVGVALQDLELHEFYADRDPRQAGAYLGSARAELRTALDVMQFVTLSIRREPIVEAGGLERALSAYLQSRVPSSVRTALSVAESADLPDEVNSELYLVVREAVRNAVRHAQAKTISVSVIVTDTEITATVDDDGQGFDAAGHSAPRVGNGLSSMADRVRLLGGKLDVVSAPEKGTTVSLYIARRGLGS